MEIPLIDHRIAEIKRRDEIISQCRQTAGLPVEPTKPEVIETPEPNKNEPTAN